MTCITIGNFSSVRAIAAHKQIQWLERVKDAETYRKAGKILTSLILYLDKYLKYI